MQDFTFMSPRRPPHDVFYGSESTSGEQLREDLSAMVHESWVGLQPCCELKPSNHYIKFG